jgi:nucleotidyltransferase/DNA polymerase involved in DNA repair
MNEHPLQEIPGVGPRTAEDLLDLGYTAVEDLRGENPETMYERLMQIREQYIDRCQLYVFRGAVYYAEGGREPEKLKWWNWKDTE